MSLITHLRIRNLIILTDPTINGDLLCHEVTNISYYSELVLLSLWSLALIVFMINNKYVKKRIAHQVDHLQFMRQLILAYPILKVFIHFSIFYNVRICLYEPDSAISWAMRYVMMIMITSDTVFWALFVGF